MTGAEIEISWRTFTGARARAKRTMTTSPVMRPYAAMLVAAGILSAVGCVTPAARPAGYDPTTMDPPSIDPSYPPSMKPAAITSHGARLNGIIYVAQGSGPHPTVILLHGYPGNERNLDPAHAMRRAGWNVVFFRYRGSWGSGGTFSICQRVGGRARGRRLLEAS